LAGVSPRAGPPTWTNNPNRADIDRAVAYETKALQQIAKEHGLSRFSVIRHQEHVTSKLAKAAHAAQATEANSLLSRIENAIATCERIADAAEDKKNWTPAVAAIRELIKALELLGRVKGEPFVAHVSKNNRGNLTSREESCPRRLSLLLARLGPRAAV
jgi:hypothetical protein